MADLPARIPRDRAQFGRDMRWSLSVCRAHPLLPLLSLLIGLAPLVSSFGQHKTVHDGLVRTAPAGPLHQLLSLLAGGVVIALAGWPGTQRLWFLRAQTGRSMPFREAIQVSFRYFGRFAVLGLALSAFLVPLLIAVGVWYAKHTQRLADGTVVTPAPSWRVLVLIGIVTVVFDVICTFVTPAIVFTSHQVRDALRIGLRLLRATWPSTAPYVLIPPLAVVAFSLYSGLGVRFSVPLVAVSTLLNLVVKGATAAYYLRVLPTPWADGALALPPTYDVETWRRG
ncbi:MAG: hypothetical protein JWP11_2307 [Frankiales bacterium]|nr:hypothetical protein [Frankiales bacterium]